MKFLTLFFKADLFKSEMKNHLRTNFEKSLQNAEGLCFVMKLKGNLFVLKSVVCILVHY